MTTAPRIKNVQLSHGQPWSEINLESPPRISPDGKFAVYVQNAFDVRQFDLWSVPLAGGAPALLSGLPNHVGAIPFQITPNSKRVVYLNDQDKIGTPELYSVPITGGPSTKISGDLVAGGHVLDFKVAPKSGQTYFRADKAVNNTVELWRVGSAGGVVKRVNRTLPHAGYDVFEYEAAVNAAGVERVVYRSGRSDVGGYKLYSAPSIGTPAQAVEISRDLVTGGAVLEFAISADGEHVVYRADALDNGRFDLHSVTVDGGLFRRLDRDDGRSVRGDFILDGWFAYYSYSNTEWYRVPITGGASVAVPKPLPKEMYSPDGKWLVYATSATLWSIGTPDNDSQQISRLNCPGQIVTPTFLGKPVFSISPDSRRVLYVAGELWSAPISGAVCG